MNKNNIFSCILMLLAWIPATIHAQSRIETNPIAAEFILKWDGFTDTKLADESQITFLKLEGASSDPERAFLPVWFALKPLNGINEVNAKIINPVFTDLEDQSKLNGIEFLNNDIQFEYGLAVDKKKGNLAMRILPLRINASNGRIQKLVSFDIEITPNILTDRNSSSPRIYAANSVLNTGDWYRVGVANDGVYKITHELLVSMGIKPDQIDPRNIRIYGNGGYKLPHSNAVPRADDLIENSIIVKGESDGVFDVNDVVIFYGQGTTKWNYTTADQRFHHELNAFCDTSYYFLTTDLGPGKRVTLRNSSTNTSNININTFDDHLVHHIDRVNLIKSGREWYGEIFEGQLVQQFSFSFPNIVSNVPVYVKSDVIARSFSNSSFTLSGNSQQLLTQIVPSVPDCYYCTFANPANSPNFTTFNSGVSDINITLTYNPSTTNAAGWLNYIELNAKRALTMVGSVMPFRSVASVGPGNVSQFSIGGMNSSIKIWDVTSAQNPIEQNFDLVGQVGNYKVHTDSLLQFIAYNENNLAVPKSFGKIGNQNLHAFTPVDMIIVAHPNFISQANRLSEFHKQLSNLKVEVVTPQQIYNEFSSGKQDVSAIRDFMKMFYDKAQSPSELPKYLLLFGDGSYDNKNRLSGNTNFIPTYQSLNSLSLTNSYVADDFYGNLDDNEGEWLPTDFDAVDLGIGRLPVKNLSEAKAVVDKIILYGSPGGTAVLQSELSNSSNGVNTYGDWRNVISFVGDDEDGNTHLYQSDALAILLDTTQKAYNIEKIYFDAYKQESTPGGQRYPGVKDAINNRLQRGALIVNYTGHGGESGWAHERVLEVSDVNAWSNNTAFPVFMTATCEFSRFDDPARTSAGELVMLNPSGGGIALATTVRLVFSTSNFELNKAFYNNLFKPVNGQMPTIGDVFRATKVATSNISNTRNFTLIGDPALHWAFPEFHVRATSINGNPISVSPDTIQGLSKVTITGVVEDLSGNKLTSFNGIVYPTVYDKASTVNTLGNDAQSPVTNFKVYKSILYKGKVSVKNGDFSFTFLVPKDIAVQYGIGKLSFYAHNGVVDANGYSDKLVIGGLNPNATVDNSGPSLLLFMNDEKFVFGGMTDNKPYLYGIVSDSSGINTSGNSIGHDITAKLDDNNSDYFILNDYYQADLDSYQSGRIRYPLSNLSSGRHNARLKLWDVFNNSSEAYTEFVVAESADLALSHVLNYPNPFTTSTKFYFEHNRPRVPLQVQVQVYTVSGKLIKNINLIMESEGFRSDAIAWDGKDDYGDSIGRGVYLYRVRVRDGEKSVEQFEKLVILK